MDWLGKHSRPIWTFYSHDHPCANPRDQPSVIPLYSKANHSLIQCTTWGLGTYHFFLGENMSSRFLQNCEVHMWCSRVEICEGLFHRWTKRLARPKPVIVWTFVNVASVGKKCIIWTQTYLIKVYSKCVDFDIFFFIYTRCPLVYNKWQDPYPVLHQCLRHPTVMINSYPSLIHDQSAIHSRL